MRSVRRQAQRVVATVLTTAALLAAPSLAGTGVAYAAPTPPGPTPPGPTPPPNPTDQQLDQSKKSVAGAHEQYARAQGQLTQVEATAAGLARKLAARQDDAEEALDAQQAAEVAARAAAARVRTTRSETEAASAAIEEAHRKLDEFITAAYLQGVDAGSLGLLIEASGPDDLVRRAELTEALATDQRAALDSLQRARVAKANADSLARAAEELARQTAAAAAAAKLQADRQVDAAEDAVEVGQAELDKVEALRADLEKQLDQLAQKDAGLRAMRQQYLDYQARLAAAASAAATGARGKVTGTVGTVIDRALSMIGTSYAWGGGTSRGPSRGIRDGGVADRHKDYRKTGFDCSGLMLYAFGGVGLGLPRYSGNQYNAGKKVPVSQMRPGDMLFWADGGRIHHVALYLGNNKMIEAPESGAKVKISDVRRDGLMPYVTRML